MGSTLDNIILLLGTVAVIWLVIARVRGAEAPTWLVAGVFLFIIALIEWLIRAP